MTPGQDTPGGTGTPVMRDLMGWDLEGLMKDDRGLEASDPSLPAERLLELLASFQAEEVQAEEGTPLRNSYRLQDTVLLNPNLPLQVLGRVLRELPVRRGSYAAWHNPMVPLLLLSEPLSGYEVGALQLLLSLEGQHGAWRRQYPAYGLPARVRMWAATRDHPVTAASHTSDCSC
ncbi:MAG: hypothetical protein EOO75_18315, partial [Myxococcales bacterium]